MRSAVRTIAGLCVLAGGAPAILNAQGAGPTGAAKWADSARVAVETAFVSSDSARMSDALLLLDRALTVYPNDPFLLHYEGYALYRKGVNMNGRGKAGAAVVFEQARTALEKSIATKPIPESYALLSSVLGNLIGSDPSLGMTLGPASAEAMETAVSVGPTNPRVWLLRGQSAFFTPEQWGGGIEVAEGYLKKARDLFAKDSPTPPLPRWGASEVYVWLGQVYQKQGKREDAAAAYTKALEIDPANVWVRRVLLPSVGKSGS